MTEADFRLTPTAKDILEYLSSNQSMSVTKSDIAKAVDCAEKTADRLMKKMREAGMIEVKENWSESGAQLANTYTVTKIAG